jgi:hypothetical protein
MTKRMWFFFALFIVIIMLFANSNTNLSKELSSKQNDISKVKENYGKLLEEVKVKYKDFETNYYLFKNKYTLLEEDIIKKRLISETQLLSFAVDNMSHLTRDFTYYSDTFKDLLNQIEWYESNITPYLKKYGDHIRILSQGAYFLPLPYITIVADGISTVLIIGDKLSQLTTLINETKKTMSAIQEAYISIQHNFERISIPRVGNLLDLKFKMQLNEISSLISVMLNMLDSTKEALEEIRNMNSTVMKLSSGLMTKVPFFKTEPGQKVAALDENAIDALINTITVKDEELRTISIECNRKIERDLDLIANISSCLTLLNNQVYASPNITNDVKIPYSVQDTKNQEGKDLETKQPATPSSINKPAHYPGDTYTVESIHPDNPKWNNVTKRLVISVEPDKLVMTSQNLVSKSKTIRTLEYTPGWNLISTRNANGSGVDFSPPLKYYEFPIYPGKTWKQNSVATNVKTGATREFSLSGVVGGWEDVSVPAGTFKGIKVTLNSEIFVPATGKRSFGTDISWYVPELRRSVKSEMTSRNSEGIEGRQLIQLREYELKNSPQ